MPEVAYPDWIEVRVVKAHGHFRWKKKDIFRTKVLWGEPVRLMPIGAGLYNLYFANRPLAGFDSNQGKLIPLNNKDWPKDKSKNMPDKQKLSEISPV